MNELNVIQHNGVDVIDSRDVAQMVGKQHKNLLRDIGGYLEILKKSNELKFEPVDGSKSEPSAELKIEPSDFFLESSYKDPTGRTLICYLLTKKGCDMVANKMTGEKGVLFTAAYVTAFEAMREQIQKAKPMTAYQEETVALQKARLLNQIAHEYEGTTYKQVLQAHVTKQLTGDFLLPLPKLEAKTYSAKEIGDILGVSAHRVGVIANRLGLKTDQYGQWFKDKSPPGSKEVSTFRYYASGIDRLREALSAEEAV